MVAANVKHPKTDTCEVNAVTVDVVITILLKEAFSLDAHSKSFSAKVKAWGF